MRTYGMLEEEDYPSTSHSSCSSSIGDLTMGGSFYSWDSDCIVTPPRSTRHGSSNSMKVEDRSVRIVNSNQENYPLSNSISSIPLSLDMSETFYDHGISLSNSEALQSHMGDFNDFPTDSFDSFASASYSSCHGLPLDAPALVADNSSPISMNFVDPTRTTLVKSQDLQSPRHALHFESPVSDYSSIVSMDHSPMGSMHTPFQYREYSSTSTTPSRASTSNFRQPVFLPTETHAALQKAQSGFDAVGGRQKRARRNGIARDTKTAASDVIRLEPASGYHCSWSNCRTSFKRSEHLKRHMRRHLKNDAPLICPSIVRGPNGKCCDRVFEAGRNDNYKTHLLLHLTGSKRTVLDLSVRPTLDLMAQNCKKKSSPANRGERRARNGLMRSRLS